MSSDKGEGTASQYPSSLSEEGLSDSWALRDVWKAGRGKQCWLRSGHVLHDGCVCVRARPRSVLSDSATPWTVACQAPLSVRFSRQEYWSGFPFTPPGDLPDAGIKPVSPVSPALAAGLFITVLPGEHLQASSHPGAAQHHGARQLEFKSRPCHLRAGAPPVTCSSPTPAPILAGVCALGRPSRSLRPTSSAETWGAHPSLGECLSPA